MSELDEASHLAIKLANDYKDRQRADAEANRKPEETESEEDFLERVRVVSETSASGFSAPYLRPVVDPDFLGTEAPEDPDELLSLHEPDAEGKILDEEAVKVEQAEAPPLVTSTEEEPSSGLVTHDPTEVVSNDQVTLVDTGFTSPQQVESAQSVITAKADAEAEEKGEAGEPVDHTPEPEEDPEKELSYNEKLAAIKEAKTSEEVNALVGDDTRKPLLNVAGKRKTELSK